MDIRAQIGLRDASHYIQQAKKDILRNENGFNILYTDMPEPLIQ